MKKCPECGNPSYDGARVCGNCGHKFPKQKVGGPKNDNIFQQKPKVKNKANDDDVMTIIKENRVVIGIILIITLIVICGIIIAGISNNSNDNLMQSGNALEYNANNFTFKYPGTWKTVNGSDVEHPEALFLSNENNTIIEFYNITSSAESLKDITQQRINNAQTNGDYIELVQTVILDGSNSSNIIMENTNGNYTRYVSMFYNHELYVFKITGNSLNAVNSEEIESVINSADIA